MPKIALASILALLSALHVAWALGLGRGLKVTVPERDGEPLFRPGPWACAAVGTALAVAAALGPIHGSGVLDRRWTTAALWVMALVFALRALGDRHWVGFTKTVRDTRFARLDTWLYSPLCLLIAALAVVVARS